VRADAGWFGLDKTRLPTADDLTVLQHNVGDAGALQPPDQWETMKDASVVHKFELPVGNPERTSVEKAFLSTLNKSKVKVIGVKRVQNLAMWQSYVVKRQTICSRETGHSNDDATQRQALKRLERSWLFHGTDNRVLDKILQQGFNRSFCGKNATLYGKGVYFARDASYSSCKTYAVPDSHGNQYVLACRVVVGEYCRGKVSHILLR
jgi:hypothetical protein